ncbi:MAG: metallopeptidase family protein [Terrimicrobiaceae bacterium]|nr:metallopeptidase family protein [Terrimicrobiaceae bacterium]
MTWESLAARAESLVATTIAELPEPVRARLADVPVVIERTPSPDDIELGILPDTLGYFDEDPLGVTRIRLWLDNIYDFADGDPDTFDEEVRTTLLHEIGHLLGWDEEEIDERGLG